MWKDKYYLEVIQFTLYSQAEFYSKMLLVKQ